MLENCNLHYDDASVPIATIADNLNYAGKGHLSKAIFDLGIQMTTDSFSLVYNGEAYANRYSV